MNPRPSTSEVLNRFKTGELFTFSYRLTISRTVNADNIFNLYGNLLMKLRTYCRKNVHIGLLVNNILFGWVLLTKN
jgi:hypothetical protein